MAAGDSCANCKFSAVRMQQTPQGQSAQLQCRRSPPTVHAQFFMLKTDEGALVPQEVANTYWPTVQPADRCGEHAVDIATTTLLPPDGRRRS